MHLAQVWCLSWDGWKAGGRPGSLAQAALPRASTGPLTGLGEVGPRTYGWFLLEWRLGATKAEAVRLPVTWPEASLSIATPTFCW